MKRLRAGVIGVGHLGQHHARHYATLPGSILTGVFDPEASRAKLIADRHGVEAWTDLAGLLRNAGYCQYRRSDFSTFLGDQGLFGSGKHVLVEKPIAATPAEARELVVLAAQRDCILQVGHSERFNPIMQRMRPCIDKPAFIECHRLSAFGERGTDVDVVLDLMIHDLDLVLSFNPGPVEEVRAAGVPVLSSNIDIANARIAFAGGCVANMTASRVSTNKMRRLRVFQRDRYVSIDFQSRQAMISRRTQDGGARPSIEVESFQAGDDEPLRLELDAFIQAVQNGSRPVVSGEDGEAALNLATRVLEAIGHFTQRHQESPVSGLVMNPDNV